VHQELGGRDVVEFECGLGRLDNPTDGAAHAARGGGQGFRHQGGPGQTPMPQGGSPREGLARGVLVLFAQEFALISEAAKAAMMTANGSSEWVPQAFLAILVPERRGCADSGAS
jgi:hypothetical protein